MVRHLLAFAVLLAPFLSGPLSGESIPVERITIDGDAPARPFRHFWERMMGSERAAVTLRESYRNDLRDVKAVSGLQYVRFHAIFHDELGVYNENAFGDPSYNFQYIDQIYDGLLKLGVRPFVELSFMPRKLALRPDIHPFWYHPIVAPPKTYARWDDLIAHFADHLIERYGIDEVSKWYFEVWNEPNLNFWTGKPPQESYFELYDHTARALKSVSERLRVGGPATAGAAWVDRFIAYVAAAHAPVDFISTHVYGDDIPEGFPEDNPVSPEYGIVCPAVQRVHDLIKASARPDLPLIISETNATSRAASPVSNSLFVGTWLADTIHHCDGLADMLSFWTFTDIFEEHGVMRRPFLVGFGLIAMDGIPKPSFAAFRILHRLGTQRLVNPAQDVLVTKRADGSLAIAAWNRTIPGTYGTAREIDLAVGGLASDATARIQRVDADHGDTTLLYEAMGSPVYPTEAQVTTLRKASEPKPPEVVDLNGGALRLGLPPNGLALIEIGP